MQLVVLCKEHHGSDAWTPSPLASPLPNCLLLLVHMAPWSSTQAKQPHPLSSQGPVCLQVILGSLVLVFVLAHLAMMGFVAVV